MQGTLFDPKSLVKESVVALRSRAIGCKKCKLSRGRRNVVFGEGNPNEPLICFVGEGPGQNEDEQGRPFVGRAGDLLNKMIGSTGLKREDVYICNVVGCRPPDNRRPEPDEIQACSEFLVGQLKIVKPKVIVTLGLTAAATLLKTKKAMQDIRGKWFEWEGVPVRPTYHPAFLLRPQGAIYKKEAWLDIQAVMNRLGLTSSEEGGSSNG